MAFTNGFNLLAQALLSSLPLKSRYVPELVEATCICEVGFDWNKAPKKFANERHCRSRGRVAVATVEIHSSAPSQAVLFCPESV
jgi:hypothetical protein